MPSRRYPIAALVAATLAVSTALAETNDELRKRIVAETKLSMVTKLTVPAAEFKDDGDPMTMEIVLLSKKEDGPSRVTDDGQVIFLYDASNKTQQDLIMRAFEIRIARAASGT